MIDPIIFVDNIFNLTYGSGTRDSRGRELAEFSILSAQSAR
jgi:hypothetical protein